MLALGSAALLVYAHFIEPAAVVVKHESLQLARLPGALSGLRIAFVSDLHVGSPHWGVASLRTALARINAEHSDLILLGGDYLTDGVKFGERVEPLRVAEELAALHAPLGVIAVLGNHDGGHGVPASARRSRRAASSCSTTKSRASRPAESPSPCSA